MSKGLQNRKVIDLTMFSKSTFTLTFAIEILGMDVWHDCNEGWLDLGPCHQAIKIQYQLYPDQTFDLDVLIWPHVAKIWCGSQYGYVRTWQFLERRWFAFSIRHAFPVRVLDLMNHLVVINCAMGLNALSNNAKNDKIIEAFLPSLKFGDQRYFAPVLEGEHTFETFIQDIIWNVIEAHIPASCLDGTFNTPSNVTDKRHQDAILFKVKEIILKENLPIEEEVEAPSDEFIKSKNRRESKMTKEKEKEKKKIVDVQKEKFMITLSGDAIMAGTGKISSFGYSGERPHDQSDIIVLISTNNLPAHDDLPIIFVNIGQLYDAPLPNFKKARITQIYTRWRLNGENHDSEKQNIKSGNFINFNDHHTIPLQHTKASEITATFLDNPFEIQLRGLRNAEIVHSHQKLFGNDKNDHKFDMKLSSNTSSYSGDILIAVTKIDASIIAKKTSTVISGEFSLYPPQISRHKLGRMGISTNDINAVRIPEAPDIIIQPSIILDAHMTMDISIGLVGCKPREIIPSYSRMYCSTHNKDAVKIILNEINEVNEKYHNTDNVNNILTGFAIDTCDIVIFYIEGEKNGPISRIWEVTGRFYPTIKPVFSCSEQYLDRIYPEMISAISSFDSLKMVIPLNTLLKCPQAYVKPALPVPAKSTLVKIGRLVKSKIKVIPFKSEMPTTEELNSFKLELFQEAYVSLSTEPATPSALKVWKREVHCRAIASWLDPLGEVQKARKRIGAILLALGA
ncbi:uncharacterized protein LOC113400951 [Vanessa tameamea]|uniref:Uncharacterized protein LOC113400951 n=1 Tax=Vanessa tameamea TaxID=334116 RepID=A0ABM4AM64_VANTA